MLLSNGYSFVKRHHVVQEADRTPGVEQRKDVRMLQARRGPDLDDESLGSEHRRQLGLEHLDRDLAIVLEVVGEIDRRHAALAQLALDAVAIGECSRQTEGGFGHPTKLRRRATWQQVPRSATVGRSLGAGGADRPAFTVLAQ